MSISVELLPEQIQQFISKMDENDGKTLTVQLTTSQINQIVDATNGVTTSVNNQTPKLDEMIDLLTTIVTNTTPVPPEGGA